MRRKRWILAYDGDAVYLRELLCITHDETTGEVRYDAKPVTHAKTILRFKRAMMALLRAAGETP